jgi:hypothetical protein
MSATGGMAARGAGAASKEPQMIMEREREHLAQVDHHDHRIVPRDVVGLIVH